MNRVFPAESNTLNSCLEADIDASKLADMFQVEKGRRIYTVILIRNGVRVLDISAHPFRSDVPQECYSMSKSFLSVAVGIAISQGLFGLEDLIIDCFPGVDHQSHLSIDKLKVKHLLTMTAGQKMSDFQRIWREANWVKAFLGTPISYEPGSRFEYNNFCSFILSALVQQKSGMRLVDYLKAHLFSTIGIEEVYWEDLGKGADWGASGLYLSADSMARFGFLLLNDGKWEGSQIIDPFYLKEATRKQTDSCSYADSVPAWTECYQGYGYHFWMNSFGGFRASGMLLQELVIVPEHDLVAVIIGCELDLQREALHIFPDFIIPACESEYATGDKSLHSEVEIFIESLQKTPQARFSTGCHGNLFELEHPVERDKIFNIHTHLEALGFEFQDDCMMIYYKDCGVVHKFACGLDGVFRVNDMDYKVSGENINIHAALRGEWEDEETFYFEIRPLSINMWIVYWVTFISDKEIMLKTYLDARSMIIDSEDSEKPVFAKGRIR